MLRILRALAGTALIGVGLISTLTLIFLAWPRLILNESVLRYFVSLLSKEGIAFTWSSVDLQAESVSFFIKRVQLDFTGLCVRNTSPAVLYNGCFDRARISATGGLVRFFPKITEAGPISLQNGRALVDLDRIEQANRNKPKEVKKKAKPFRIEDVIPLFLRGTKVHPIDIEFSKFALASKGKTVEGTLSLSERNSKIDLTGLITASQNDRQTRTREKYELSLKLANDRDFWAWNHWSANGRARAKFADGRDLSLVLNVLPRFVEVQKEPEKRRWFKLKRTPKEEAVALRFSLDGKTTQGKQRISVGLNGTYEPKKIEARISGSAHDLIPEISAVSLNACALSIEREKEGAARDDSRYRVNCLVKGTIPIPPERLRFLEIPTEAGIRVQADLLASDFIPTDSTQLEGSVDLVMLPVLSPLLQGRGEIHGRLAGVAGELPKTGEVDSRLAIELSIPDFQWLSKKLGKTDWGIPAPFQALEGSLTVRAAGSSSLDQGFFPLRLQTRLKSTSQDMNLDAGGTLEVVDLRNGPKTQLNFALTLSDLKVLLPRLKLEKPPRLVPEDRIHSFSQAGAVESKEAPKNESFGYRAVIRTLPGKPVQVITNLAKAPIPVNLDVNLSNDTPPMGKIDIGTFPVEAFRRKATVQRFDIDLVPKVGESAIDGRVDVPVGDYKTHIDLVGSIDKPQVKVTSDPPVGEDQLLAALLFNRNPEELDPSESAAVGSTRATVSQGALSLASLFLLASTPIESLTYNPDTGQVTAQVRLSEGLSLNVGSGEKQAGAVGLRKRLGSNFFVTTDVNNIIQNSSTVSAYIEWRKRY